MSNGEIAEELVLSNATVKTHVDRRLPARLQRQPGQARQRLRDLPGSHRPDDLQQGARRGREWRRPENPAGSLTHGSRGPAGELWPRRPSHARSFRGCDWAPGQGDRLGGRHLRSARRLVGALGGSQEPEGANSHARCDNRRSPLHTRRCARSDRCREPRRASRWAPCRRGSDLDAL